MRDGRQHWKLPSAGDPDTPVVELVAQAREAGCVLVADGRTLHLTAPRGWPEAELPALAARSAAIVRALYRASDARLAAGQHQGAAMTGPDGRPVLIPAGHPVPLLEVADQPAHPPRLRIISADDRQANVERMIADSDIGDDIERQAIQEIDRGAIRDEAKES